MRFLFLFTLALIFSCTSLLSQTFWQPTKGPEIGGSNIRSYAIDSSGNKYVVALTKDDKFILYRSTDDGNSWNDISAGLISVNTIVQTLSVTCSKDFVYAVLNNGLYVSSDYGMNWEKLLQDDPFSSSITIGAYTDISGNVYIVISDWNWSSLIKYDPVSKTFMRPDNLSRVKGIFKIQNDRFGNLYVVTIPTNLSKATNNIFKSTDMGNEWQLVNFEMPVNEYQDLFVDNDGAFYAITSEKIFINYPGSDTWQQFSLPASSLELYKKNICVGIDNKVYLMISERPQPRLYVSTDSCRNWIEVDCNYHYQRIRESIALKNGGMLICTDNGLYECGQNNTLVSKNGGLSSYTVTGLSYGRNNRIISGMSYNANGEVYYSDDKGQTWTKGSIEKGITKIMTHPDGHVFALTYLGLYSSSDNGSNWEMITSRIYASQSFDIDRHGTLYATSGETGPFGIRAISKSTDLGQSWQKILGNQNSPDPLYVFTDIHDHIYYARASDFNGNLVSISRSTDQGQTWKDLVIDISKPPTSMINTSNGYLFMGTTDKGVYRSTDKGANWTAKNSGIENICVNALIVTKNDSLLAGTNDGVYLSTDLGDSWEKLTSGMGDLPVYSLAVSTDGYVYAGSNIVYRTTIPRGIVADVVENDKPEQPSDIVISPNPVTDKAVIILPLDDINRENSNINIFDIQGRLVSKYQCSSNSLEIQTNEFQPGLYYCQYISGSEIKTMTFIVNK